MNNLFLEVAINLPINSTFYYSIQEDQIEKAKIGKRIKVPFNNREATGYIVGFKDNTEIHDIKEIISIDEEEFFDEKMLKFYRWISGYYFSPLGEVIAANSCLYTILQKS
jgi:primosomal protein N' (replication factor Y)